MGTGSIPAGALGGTFRIGGELEVKRLGFGAMRITGEGIWGDPPDHDRAIAVLRRVRELGIDFIDTADSYGPHVSQDPIHKALHPYGDNFVATKGGPTRHGPNHRAICGRPEYLRQCCLMSMRRLEVEQIDLWQLHRIDPKVPREEQFECMAKMQQDGLVRFLGLSEVSVEEIEAAKEFFDVATVQNLYNLGNRQAEDVLDYCTEHGIGFIPWFPLQAGSQTGPQEALAWLLARSPVMLPIPGTGSVEHLEENAAAGDLQLGAEELEALGASSS